MARSVGEAAARGLESGLRLSMDITDRRRQRERQDQADALAREDRAMAMEDRSRSLADQQRQREAQERAQRLQALDAQRAGLADEARGLGVSAAPADRQRIVGRLAGLQSARNRELAAAGGLDFEAEEQQAQQDIQALDAGQGGALPPARRVRAILSATRRDIGDFRRGPGGEPSRVRQAADDFRQGLANNDPMMLLAGANVVLEPDLRKGIGEASPHGGTIVAKTVEAFDPAPDSTPDNPKFMPRLRVWVKGDPPRSKQEEAALKKWREANPNAPEGATAYYFAPVTADRSSRPDAPVKTIGVREGFEYLNRLLQLEEILNAPDAAADLDAGIAEIGPERYEQTLAALGIATGRPVKSEFRVMTPGSEGRVVTTDDRGQVSLGEPIAGPERTFPPPRAGGGAGGAGGAGRIRVQSTRVGTSGNILLIMSDGSVKDTGQKDASLGRAVANMISRMSKDSFEFRELPFEEQQQRALDMLGATLPQSAAPAGAPAPGPAQPGKPDFSHLWKR